MSDMGVRTSSPTITTTPPTTTGSTTGTGGNPLQGLTASVGNPPNALARFANAVRSWNPGQSLSNLKASVGRFFSRVDNAIANSHLGRAVESKLAAIGTHIGKTVRGTTERMVDNALKTVPQDPSGTNFQAWSNFVDRNFDILTSKKFMEAGGTVLKDNLGCVMALSILDKAEATGQLTQTDIDRLNKALNFEPIRYGDPMRELPVQPGRFDQTKKDVIARGMVDCFVRPYGAQEMNLSPQARQQILRGVDDPNQDSLQVLRDAWTNRYAPSDLLRVTVPTLAAVAPSVPMTKDPVISSMLLRS